MRGLHRQAVERGGAAVVGVGGRRRARGAAEAAKAIRCGPRTEREVGALRAPPRCPAGWVAADGLARERLKRADDVADHPAVLAAQPLDEHRDEGLVPQREARFVAGRRTRQEGSSTRRAKKRRGRSARVALGEAHERVGERDPRLDGLVGDAQRRVHPRDERGRGRGGEAVHRAGAGEGLLAREARLERGDDRGFLRKHAERAQHRAGGGTVARARRRERVAALAASPTRSSARHRLEDRGVALLGRRGGERAAAAGPPRTPSAVATPRRTSGDVRSMSGPATSHARVASACGPSRRSMSADTAWSRMWTNGSARTPQTTSAAAGPPSRPTARSALVRARCS